ncbi:30S ribosomal protein S9 [Candidatus Woesearchaeota archaeon CG10_big_fil_rev_8_21_14_0_10_34_12]|nr:MAG: 30S ribosomal protein S9 [Candidatus Woesearchaeota archaeon CG10_big_fil_rev_8_21_14_0_10_34_12]
MEKQLVVSGKRKTAIARATIVNGNGKVIINKKPYQLLPLIKRFRIEEPLRITTEKLGKLNFDINVNVVGGGQAGQIEAARLAIAKAIVEFTKNAELKKTYHSYDRHLLVADTRRKESYKPGDSKARSKRQKSYR